MALRAESLDCELEVETNNQIMEDKEKAYQDFQS